MTRLVGRRGEVLRDTMVPVLLSTKIRREIEREGGGASRKSEEQEEANEDQNLMVHVKHIMKSICTFKKRFIPSWVGMSALSL